MYVSLIGAPVKNSLKNGGVFYTNTKFFKVELAGLSESLDSLSLQIE